MDYWINTVHVKFNLKVLECKMNITKLVILKFL